MNTLMKQAAVPETGHKAKAAMERSGLYGFLASVFRAEPTAAMLNDILKAAFGGALKAAGIDLVDSLSGRSDNDLTQDLAVEYARLFIGPGPHTPPYASVNLGGGGASLWGPETVRVKRFIEDAGFDYKPDFHSLPDHIAVELEFMQEMAAREAKAPEDGNEDQALLNTEAVFLTDHLAPWVPTFCAKITSQARLPFYKEMAALTVDFILSEEEELAPTPS